MKDNMDKEKWISDLVETHERPLCAYSLSILHNLELARDAVQDTFLRLCKQEPAQLAGHEKPWLFKVCRNRSLDILRKEKPMENLSTESEGAIPDLSTRPDEQAERKDEGRRLPAQLAKLPENQQEVLQLKFQQQLSYREIANITELSESNVGYLIHMGIKTLRENMLQQEGVAS